MQQQHVSAFYGRRLSLTASSFILQASQEFSDAAYAGDIPKLEAMLADGIDINTADDVRAHPTSHFPVRANVDTHIPFALSPRRMALLHCIALASLATLMLSSS